MGTFQQVIDDLRTIFYSVPVECLRHLRDNQHRLTRFAYTAEGGKGCLMYLLTERLPASEQINCRPRLVRYFGGDPDAPEYQPARWIVRLWDEQVCENVLERYGANPKLTVETVAAVLDTVIAERTAAASLDLESPDDVMQHAEPMQTCEELSPATHNVRKPAKRRSLQLA